MAAATIAERDITPVIDPVGEDSAAAVVAVPTAESESPVEARRPVSYGFVPPDMWALARGIAAVLGETMPPPIRLITRVVDRFGPDRARAVLGQALTIEAQGGLTLPDGHRRTPGGTFLYLVRTSDEVSREDKAYIFPRYGGRPMRQRGTTCRPRQRLPRQWPGRTRPIGHARSSSSKTMQGGQPP